MLTFAKFKDLTRLEQSLFGLPFMLTGALIPLFTGQYSWGALWIFPAFLTARFSGMAFNQLIDRQIDARNPRTKDRPVASGLVSPLQATIVAWSSLLIFLLVCAQINGLCLLLSPIAACLLVLYSYMKRVHSSCHFVLGLIHFLAPVMAWAALSGHLGWSPVFLGLTAFCSISGNDIVYAQQDLAFDREQGLHSLPSKLGIFLSLWIARALHLLTVLFLVCFGLIAQLGPLYYGAPLCVAYFLFRFHLGLNPARFFICNVSVSLAVFMFTLGDLLWHV